MSHFHVELAFWCLVDVMSGMGGAGMILDWILAVKLYVFYILCLILLLCV
jgi:hypothetical protein